MQPYLLAPHVYPCVSGQHVVLMDLERDKYVAVVPAHRLAAWVRGWPVDSTETPDPPQHPDAGADALVSQMLAHGMLVRDPQVGKPAVPVSAARVTRSLVEFDLDSRPRTGAALLWRFGCSYLQAQLSLKLRPIQAIVEAVRDRKAPRRLRRSPREADAVRLRALVSAFTRLRPLFYTLRSACLLDSLTMLLFLRAEGIHPEWVFGVKTEPFDAHCWVQHGDVVLNDAPDRVRQYSPILVV
ncbi:MAG TPA: lasso peptide biosynthesis B2 protein [Steroidobacteraceae bacterium]|nr:lasso peptide biosynthesis B2 protein [Steroidobacteraceae bacterium]